MKTNKTIQKEKKENDLNRLKKKRDDLLIQIKETTDYEQFIILQKKCINLMHQIEVKDNIESNSTKKNYSYNPITVIKNTPSKRCG